MKKLLVCKDILQNKLIKSEVLIESDNFKFLLIDNPPTIEPREGMIGEYQLNELGEIVVVYRERQKTELELINEKLDIILGSSTSRQEQ